MFTNDSQFPPAGPPRPLLIVEDSDEDFAALQRAFKKLGIANPVQRCLDGDDCLEYLNHTGRYEKTPKQPVPAVILLDLNMPATDGRQTLQEIKTSSRLRIIPITILTTSSNPRDVQTCYDFGANAYVLKPLDFDELLRSLKVVTDFWLRTVVPPIT